MINHYRNGFSIDIGDGSTATGCGSTRDNKFCIDFSTTSPGEVGRNIMNEPKSDGIKIRLEFKDKISFHKFIEFVQESFETVSRKINEEF